MQHLPLGNVIGDMEKIQLPYYWVLLGLGSLCGLLGPSPLLAQAVTPTTPTPPYFFPYRLHQPVASFELPKKLIEISGLSLTADGQYLAVIQDEDGLVFLLDKKAGKVIREIPFGKSGDYEGVETVGEDLFVVKSSSKIYHLRQYAQAEPEVFKYSTPLTKEYDIEGLCYDANRRALLLACKGQPDVGEKAKKDLTFAKAIYAFSLDKQQLDTIPLLVIDRKDIVEYFKTHPLLIKVNDKGEIKRSKPEKLPCYPSAIAIHPITNNYYITSSKGKVLFIVSPEGRMLHIEQLDKRLHPQPEGLAFEPDGTLYLSNEGKDDRPARIYRFPYQALPKQ